MFSLIKERDIETRSPLYTLFTLALIIVEIRALPGWNE
jgi:hypothetical protein